MLKLVLAFTLAIPGCVYCQSYATSPFYKSAPSVPSEAHADYSLGSIKANGIVIDVSDFVSPSSPGFDKIRGWDIGAWADRNTASHVFHYYRQYSQLNAVFGYDLIVEPVPGTDEIRCTFSAFTDPSGLPETAAPRDKNIPVVALPGDLTPLVIKSGGVIAITTLPLGDGGISAVNYLRLTRTDLPAHPNVQP